jgi:hypothetical protein
VALLMKKPRYRIRSLMLLVAIVAIGLSVASAANSRPSWIDESLIRILVLFGPALLVFVVAELIFERFDRQRVRRESPAMHDQSIS